MKMTYAWQGKKSVLSGGYAKAEETDSYKVDATVSLQDRIKQSEKQQS